MGHIGKGLISVFNGSLIFLATVITDDAQKNVMFFLGAGAAVFTIIHKGQEIYHRHNDRKQKNQK